MVFCPEKLVDKSKETRDLSKILREDCFCDLTATAKNDVLAELCGMTSLSSSVTSSERFFRDILSRERVMTTGIGNGIGIPHARSGAVTDFVIAVGRSREGIEFEALDSLPVHIVILLGAPERARNEFLQIFAKIGEMFAQPGIKQRILDVNAPKDIMSVFLEYLS